MENCSFTFDQANNGTWYEVVRWTVDGNPIIRIGYNDIHFEPTDLSLIHYGRYQRELDENWRSLTDITRRRPISAHIFVGDPSHSPQFKVRDGHHRYFFARSQKTDVYVKIGDIYLAAPYKYGMTWGQAKQHAIQNNY